MFENSINTILSCAIITMITGSIGSGSGGPNFMFCPRAQYELVTPLSIKYRGGMLWNKLPYTLRLYSSRAYFKMKVKIFLTYDK